MNTTLTIAIATIASTLLLLAGCPPANGGTTTASEADSEVTGASGGVITTSINESSGSETSSTSTSASSGSLGSDTSSTTDTAGGDSTSTAGPESSESSDGTSDATTGQVICQPGPKETFGPCDADHECDGGICIVTASGTMCSPPCEACEGGNQCIEDIGGLGPDNFQCTQSGNVSMCMIRCVLLNPDASTCQGDAVCDPIIGVCVWPG